MYFAGNTQTVNTQSSPFNELLYTEPYEPLSVYNDYFQEFGPTNQVGVNEAAWGAFLTMDGLNIPSTVSLNEHETNFGINIYPNPTNEGITIEAKDEILKIELYSMDGKLILSKESNSKSVSLNLAVTSQGYYVVKVVTASNIGYSKILKQ